MSFLQNFSWYLIQKSIDSIATSCSVDKQIIICLCKTAISVSWEQGWNDEPPNKERIERAAVSFDGSLSRDNMYQVFCYLFDRILTKEELCLCSVVFMENVAKHPDITGYFTLCGKQLTNDELTSSKPLPALKEKTDRMITREKEDADFRAFQKYVKTKYASARKIYLAHVKKGSYILTQEDLAIFRKNTLYAYAFSLYDWRRVEIKLRKSFFKKNKYSWKVFSTAHVLFSDEPLRLRTQIVRSNDIKN